MISSFDAKIFFSLKSFYENLYLKLKKSYFVLENRNSKIDHPQFAKNLDYDKEKNFFIFKIYSTEKNKEFIYKYSY